MKGTDRYRIEGASCMYGDRVLRVGNISVGGFYVETLEPPEQGAVLKLPLSLPQRPALSIVGKVAWVNARSHPRHSALPPGFGFNMQRIAFNDKMTILACLRGLQAEPDGPSQELLDFGQGLGTSHARREARNVGTPVLGTALEHDAEAAVSHPPGGSRLSPRPGSHPGSGASQLGVNLRSDNATFQPRPDPFPL